jgi:hypothetical protein
VHRRPLLEVSRRQPREILTSASVRMSEQAPFYLFITFVLTYGTEHLDPARDDLLNDTIVARRGRPGQRAAVRPPVRPDRPAQAPLIAAWILMRTGSGTWISWYIVGCRVVSMTALALMPRPTAGAGQAGDRPGPGRGGRPSPARQLIRPGS